MFAKLKSLKTVKQRPNDFVVTNKWIHLAILLVFIPLFYIFFKPSLREFLTFYIIDLVAFNVCVAFDFKLYYKLYPDTKLYFPTLSKDLTEVRDNSSRTRIVNSIQNFPRDRSVYYLSMSTFKIIPGFLYIVLVTGSDNGYFLAFFKAMIIAVFTFSFAISMSYFAYHNVMTETLNKIHELYDWPEVFLRAQSRQSKTHWLQVETFSTSILVLFFSFAAGLIIFDRSNNPFVSFAEFLYVLASAVLFIVMITISSRRQHQSAIHNLVTKVKSTIGERDQLMEEYAEKSTLATIGVNTGLFVHDISKMFAIIDASLWVSQKSEDVGFIKKQLENIKTANSTASKLIGNLRRSIREENGSIGIGSPHLAFNDMVEINKMLFKNDLRSSVTYLNEVPEEIRVGIRQPLLSHFLNNLLTNSTKNFIENAHPSPVIRLSLQEARDHELVLKYEDNGSGFLQDDFAALLSAKPLVGKPSAGIGLRYTKLLVDQQKGSLQVVDLPEGGACFLLTLPKVEEDNLADNSEIYT